MIFEGTEIQQYCPGEKLKSRGLSKKYDLILTLSSIIFIISYLQFWRFFYFLEFLEIFSLLKSFLSILSKHVEHNKCPFLIQNVFVDLSISLRQIRHLKIGAILMIKIATLVINNLINYFIKNIKILKFINTSKFLQKNQNKSSTINE